MSFPACQVERRSTKICHISICFTLHSTHTTEYDTVFFTAIAQTITSIIRRFRLFNFPGLLGKGSTRFKLVCQNSFVFVTKWNRLSHSDLDHAHVVLVNAVRVFSIASDGALENMSQMNFPVDSLRQGHVFRSSVRSDDHCADSKPSQSVRLVSRKAAPVLENHSSWSPEKSESTHATYSAPRIRCSSCPLSRDQKLSPRESCGSRQSC